MCGIAGYSLSPRSRASIARWRRRRCSPESPSAAPTRSATRYRGSDRRVSDPQAALRRERPARASRTPASATEALVHVRDYTKGHPRIEANNHPIRHGAVVGDPQRDHPRTTTSCSRATASSAREPEMTVDSEAIFALAEHADGHPRRSRSSAARWRPRGSTSGSPPRSSSPAASGGRSGSAPAATSVFFASTRDALEVVERTCG